MAAALLDQLRLVRCTYKNPSKIHGIITPDIAFEGKFYYGPGKSPLGNIHLVTEAVVKTMAFVFLGEITARFLA